MTGEQIVIDKPDLIRQARGIVADWKISVLEKTRASLHSLRRLQRYAGTHHSRRRQRAHRFGAERNAFLLARK